MDVTLLCSGCPNRPATTEEAEVIGRRSPTVLVDGRDPLADPDPPIGLSCRAHRTAAGSAGAPTVQTLLGTLR